ncbi:hypothetical protein PpBr36_08384 [Pyricularia pennisetigena]|uniref:hypothetical protein n=1 Tax=Pyricularia pennisetigena TaxID=1578925 RepID=UPI0011504CBC|nr:hypothetical protein PpBr36_08384 [Pyricularia pennisetigena]TLS24213.1 hypothetical protein PpBr36_08384 [Pyricularia pennisetigena]
MASSNLAAGQHDNPIKIEDEEKSLSHIDNEDEDVNLLQVEDSSVSSSSESYSTATDSLQNYHHVIKGCNSVDTPADTPVNEAPTMAEGRSTTPVPRSVTANFDSNPAHIVEGSMIDISEPQSSSPLGSEATTIPEAEIMDISSRQMAHENTTKRPLENTDSEQQDKKRKPDESFDPERSEEIIQQRLFEDLKVQQHYRVKAESRVQTLKEELEKRQEALETAQAKSGTWHDKADELEEQLQDAIQEQRKTKKEWISAKQQRTRAENKLALLEKQFKRLQDRLAESEKEISAARADLAKQRDVLILKDKKMQELIRESYNEKQQREAAEQKAGEFKKRWKQTALKLDRNTRIKPLPHQVSDQDLVGEVEKLRYKIANFAATHFDGKPLRHHEPDQDFSEILNNLTPADVGAVGYLHSTTRCPSIVQAFIWTELRQAVFGCFLWAERCSEPLSDLVEGMSNYGSNYLKSPGTSFVFHEWRVKTANLMADMKSGFPELHQNRGKEKSRIASKIKEKLVPFRRTQMPGVFAQELQAIVDQAAALDMEMARQLAHLKWLSPDCRGHCSFDEETMALDKGEDRSTRPGRVLLVVAPGLTKCGKSTGEDFDRESVLLKAEVTCDLAPLVRGIQHQ